MKLLRSPLGALAFGVGLAFSPLAQATLVLGDGSVFNGFVSGSGSNYQLTLRMDFTATAGGAFLGDRIEAWSLQLPGAATSTLVSAPVDTSWTVYNTGKAVGGNNGCGNGNVDTICVDRNNKAQLDGTGPLVTNAFFDWVLNITFASPQVFTGGGNFHLLAVQWDADKDEWKKDAGLISENLGVFLTCTPNPAGGGCALPPPPQPPPLLGAAGSVPEPGSLALLGVGALVVGVFRRRQLKPKGSKA